MRFVNWFYRQIAVALITVLVAPPGFAAAAPGPEATQAQPSASDTGAKNSPQNTASEPTVLLADAPQPQTAPGNPESAGSQATANQGTQHPTPPLGTAAAPAEPASGVAASRPAGAAIAPARQKRERAFVIRVGLLVGAAIAVGTVVALSSASPSRPH